MEEKTYFVPGDHVVLKHDLDHKPEKMLVKEKVERFIQNKDGKTESIFLGIKCIWFNKNGELQEAVFSTKDLKHC